MYLVTFCHCSSIPASSVVCFCAVLWAELSSSSAVKAALCTQYTESCGGIVILWTSFTGPLGWRSVAWRISWLIKLYTGGIRSTLVVSHNMTCWFRPLNVKESPDEVCSITGPSSFCRLQHIKEKILNLQMLLRMKVPPMEIRMGPSSWGQSNVGLIR